MGERRGADKGMKVYIINGEIFCWIIYPSSSHHIMHSQIQWFINYGYQTNAEYRIHTVTIIVVPFYNIITQTKVGYFKAPDYVALLLLPSYYYWVRDSGGLEWNNIHTKAHENWSICSKVERNTYSMIILKAQHFFLQK